ncbi:MAG TPA: LamG domain-containing protein, partial [Candidatus Paceibacterota bacterium]|nr:LamG domain-containing protein [Candidatus Paceibacterota bacterium]
MFASLYASVQGQTPIDKTPLLHLSFDNVSGTTVLNDGSGGVAMNGTLNGTASIVSGGKFGNCLSITGANASDASCRIANSVVPLNGSSTWTVAMWVQTTTAGGCYAYQGSGGWADGNTSFYLNQGNGNPGTLAGGVRWGQNWVSGTSDITSGGTPTWHHIVISCDGSTRSVYVDGVQENSGDTDWGASGTGNQFWIGGNASNNDGAQNMNGLVDEVYVFNRTLSQADITQLYNNNTVPKVPVSVTVNPTSGYRGQVFTVTATATPAVGTVTNAKVNLSAIGLSSTATLVQSSVNVFTNTFTTPATAPVGAALLTATVISTEPLVGSSGATFTVVAKPPTNAIVLTQLTNTTAYQYTKTTFRFATTNDAPNDAPFPMTYAWYKNGTLVSTNAMGPNYTFLTVPGDNGAQIYAIARVADTNFSSISVTSAVVTLT